MTTPQTPRPLVTRLRGIANAALLITVLIFAIGWAIHMPSHHMAALGLIAITLFILSSLAILIENRHLARMGRP